MIARVARLRIALVEGQEGSITVFGLFLLLATMMVGGLALDAANAYRVRAHLQVAADIAAHAAIVARAQGSESAAQSLGARLGNASLPANFGDPLRAGDIRFGRWDAATGTFTPSGGATQAVMVDALRVGARGTSVRTHLLRLVGVDTWDVVRQSVFESYVPACLREGYFALQAVDVTSNNHYAAGFCIHSQSHIEANNGNTYEAGVIISMPDRSDIVLPSSGWGSNPGLPEALREASYALPVLDMIEDIIAGVQTPGSPHYRDFVTSPIPRGIDTKDKLETQWQEGRIHVASCSSPKKKLRASNSVALRRGVLVTDCIVNLPTGVVFEDVVIVSTSTDASAISAAQGVQLGRNDGCAPGGGTQLVTRGGVTFAAGAAFHSGQAIAARDISFTSGADALEGVSLIAAGEIRGTTNSTAGFCGNDAQDDNFAIRQYRMAR